MRISKAGSFEHLLEIGERPRHERDAVAACCCCLLLLLVVVVVSVLVSYLCRTAFDKSYKGW